MTSNTAAIDAIANLNPIISVVVGIFLVVLLAILVRFTLSNRRKVKGEIKDGN